MSQMLGKMTDLGNHIISGLMANPTLTTESIVIFVNEHNKEAITNMAPQTTTSDDVDIRPGMDMEDTETRMSKLEKKYKIQEGAGQGRSICKLSLLQSTLRQRRKWEERRCLVLSLVSSLSDFSKDA